MSAHPIPLAALDDRLGIVGTAGSGKTYAAGTAVERLLAHGSRVIIPDPLGVWWGLRLLADGKHPSPFDVVIFGGPHGDLPITEHAGRLVGEAVAGMKESAIVDLSELGTKAAERRFMLAFLTALYRKASNEPVHVVFDEADLWAPQQIRDRDQDPAKLLSVMESIVRRGRVRGFVPWLITQRPAVVNKDVLSQVDGLVALKLTASQDRKALGAWIEGQADRDAGKAILARLPEKQVGEAIVWIPARGVLADAKFPEKLTYDSSRTPKKGERKKAADLKPLDVAALKDQLASIEAEVKATDPRALKGEVVRLQRELEAARKASPAPAAASKVDLDGARHSAALAGFQVGFLAGAKAEGERATVGVLAELEAVLADVLAVQRRASALHKAIAGRRPATSVPREAFEAFDPAKLTFKSTPRAKGGDRVEAVVNLVAAVDRRLGDVASGARGALPNRDRSIDGKTEADGADVTPAKQKILIALRQLEAIGKKPAEKDSVAWFAGASPSSSSFTNNIGALRSAGLIAYPGAGVVQLTDLGEGIVPPQPALSHEELLDLVAAKVAPAQLRMLKAAIAVYPEPIPADALAEAVGASSSSSSFTNNKGRLRSLGLIEYPAPGQVRAAEVLFP